ncbi:MAG: MoaD/ThiS family protein [Anaerolineales bacterium]|nr:MoaD/ThiS family protein [Anaerolineales bacterium]
MIRVILPYHLSNLARVGREVTVAVAEPASISAVLDALEAQFPQLQGTLRDYATRQRRAFIRFFAVGRDLSHDPPDAPLPPEIVTGAEPLRIVGAMAGG